MVAVGGAPGTGDRRARAAVRAGLRARRPGGPELTRRLLAEVGLAGSDVVELAPGLGGTATEIIAMRPRSYRGVDADPLAARVVRALVVGRGTVQVAAATRTGLPRATADVVIGEAVLTGEGERARHAVVAEASRLLRSGGRYAVHELAVLPDAPSDDAWHGLAAAIGIDTRPLTRAEWCALLAGHGLVVERVHTAPPALPRSGALDGALGAARRLRDLLARSTARGPRSRLVAIGVIARKP